MSSGGFWRASTYSTEVRSKQIPRTLHASAEAQKRNCSELRLHRCSDAMNVFKTQESANVGIDFTHDHEYVSTIINMHFVIRTPGMFSAKGALKSADSDSSNRNLSVCWGCRNWTIQMTWAYDWNDLKISYEFLWYPTGRVRECKLHALWRAVFFQSMVENGRTRFHSWIFHGARRQHQPQTMRFRCLSALCDAARLHGWWQKV
jgi:hypothetical protein